jgi:hypothetical protein
VTVCYGSAEVARSKAGLVQGMGSYDVNVNPVFVGVSGL